jgi:phosphoribosylformylglycinamidine synthase
MIKPEVYRQLGLTDQEYQKILDLLGREPRPTELAMFSVEWSEHCGYTKSKKYLKTFPQNIGKYKPLVGEDAGGVIVDDLAVVFKMESHNHPSQVEPKQGAATGVGGIIRDIFTCGARPIACMDSLRFGELDQPYNRYLLKGVVDGIAFYGNCIGIPTVGGEVYFDNAYSGNCLVNAFCLGIAKKDKLFRAIAKGTGNSIMYLGSSTGRDGIGGCSVLASHEFGENEEKRPTVQIGDPFTEKCLVEATMEALETGRIVGIKDMGAAGLTCSTSEMAASGGVGMDVDISLVPRREEGMEPWEVMMSESQERMLVCIEKGHEQEISDIFEKWDLHGVVIGKVTDDGILRIRDKGEIVAELPAHCLTEPPLYDMPAKEPEYLKETRSFRPENIKIPKNCNKALCDLLASPTIANKKWVYEQYDHMVQVNTSVYPGGDASVLRLKGYKKGLALSSDCNGLYCYLNPYRGAEIAVAECARNIACTGGVPAGLTDCLNFGSPDKPDRYWQFKNAVSGIVDACKFFNIPVISGNVSFYNESPNGAIFPTPSIAMVGVIDDISKRMTSHFRDKQDVIILIGENRNELGGSEYLKRIHGLKTGDAPELDMRLEKSVQEVCVDLIKKGLVKSAHDCSEGGLAVSIAESCIKGNMGANINISEDFRTDAVLFGESQSRIVVSCQKTKSKLIEKILKTKKLPYKVLGKTGGKNLDIKINEKKLISLSVEKISEIWNNSINQLLESPLK